MYFLFTVKWKTDYRQTMLIWPFVSDSWSLPFSTLLRDSKFPMSTAGESHSNLWLTFLEESCLWGNNFPTIKRFWANLKKKEKKPWKCLKRNMILEQYFISEKFSHYKFRQKILMKIFLNKLFAKTILHKKIDVFKKNNEIFGLKYDFKTVFHQQKISTKNID